MRMEQQTLNMRFLCPAFVGDARQSAVWRTPPIKAQLRQWWRVVMASRGCDDSEIRKTEGWLFGDAAGEGGNKSRVRVRLSHWKAGSLNEWAPRGGSNKLAVGDGRNSIPADLYLGYGPIAPGPKLKADRAIDAGEEARLRLAWPEGECGAEALRRALSLMNRLGALGGRSRNGWGSYVLEGAQAADLADYQVDWREAVENHPWARGIGFDDRGLLVWKTDEQDKWERVIHRLGQIRKDVCTAVPQRCLLSYPVTKKSLPAWKNTDRVPNSLRFKIVPGDNGGLCGLIFHMPCRPADRLWNALDERVRAQFPSVWQMAHRLLDESGAAKRVTE